MSPRRPMLGPCSHLTRSMTEGSFGCARAESVIDQSTTTTKMIVVLVFIFSPHCFDCYYSVYLLTRIEKSKEPQPGTRSMWQFATLQSSCQPGCNGETRSCIEQFGI